MKRSFLILAFASFFGFASFATETKTTDNPNPTNKQTEEEQSELQQNKDNNFEEISLDQVPEAVNSAALQDNANASIETAEEKVLPSGEKVYRLKMAGALAETKTYTKDGKEYTEDNEEDLNRAK